MIILEVMDNLAATVVPLMKWTDRGNKGKIPPGKRANIFFEGLSEDKILDFAQGKIVHKTELFQMPPGEELYRGTPLLVKKEKMDELKKLVDKIYLVGSSKETQCDPGGDTPAWPDRPKPPKRHATY